MSQIPSTAPIQAIPAEAPVADAPAAAVPPPEQVSKHFAALAKKEKALFRHQEALKVREAELTAQQARVAELEAKYGYKPASPREALERYGFDYKTATDFELNDGAPTPEFIAKQAQEEVKKLREEQTEREKKAAEKAQQQAEQDRAQVIEDFKGEIQEFVADKAEEYELIKFHEAYEVVYLTIEQHYTSTGKLLSIPEGANMVEKYLEKKAEELQSLKKIAKTRQGDPPAPESGFRRQPEFTAQRRTLDNTVTSSTPTLMKSPQVEDDRMKRALAALDRR